MQRAEAFRKQLAQQPLALDGADALELNVSIGVAVFEQQRYPDGDSLYHAADLALYRAKASGRNAVHLEDSAELSMAG